MIIKEAVRLHLKKIIVQGDSNLVVQAINRKEQSTDWTMENIIKDINHLLGNFEEWKIVKIHRNKD